MAFPRAGGINWNAIAVRSEPAAAAPRIGVLRESRADYRHQVVFALTVAVGAPGTETPLGRFYLMTSGGSDPSNPVPPTRDASS